jgi:hypothetical protein
MVKCYMKMINTARILLVDVLFLPRPALGLKVKPCICFVATTSVHFVMDMRESVGAYAVCTGFSRAKQAVRLRACAIVAYVTSCSM